MSDKTQAALNLLGLKESLIGKTQHAYIAVIDRGKVIQEELAATSSNKIIADGTISNNLHFHVESAGLPAGDFCSIIINEYQYAVNKRGLNFVVYDNKSGKVVDSVVFDTWAENNPAFR